jgi:hypothetical protein
MTKPKGAAKQLVRTPQQKAAATRAAKQQLEKANAVRLAQIVNLHIAGYSLADIGAQIGATPEEVDRLLAQDAQRYVRSQPQLRAYVRNYISAKYTRLLDTVWDRATDKMHPDNLDAFDRAEKILRDMERLHGAAMPQQHEVQMDAAPEAVERLVNALAAQQGRGYDTSIFDVVDAELVEDSAEQAQEFLETHADDESAPGEEL